MNGYYTATGKPVKGFGDLKADGTTACGAWIYSGVYAPTAEEPEGHNHAANRNGDDWVALGWGFAWPANRRILYNRAAADRGATPGPRRLGWPDSSATAPRAMFTGTPTRKVPTSPTRQDWSAAVGLASTFPIFP